MTNAILRGKPDAGNPHVRFDEGEVASAKPRRGSLLYKMNAIPKAVRAAILSTAAIISTSSVLGADVVDPIRIVSSCCSASGACKSVTLGFSRLAAGGELWVAWGATDGGGALGDWENSERLKEGLGDPEPDLTVSIPAGAKYVRFFCTVYELDSLRGDGKAYIQTPAWFDTAKGYKATLVFRSEEGFDGSSMAVFGGRSTAFEGNVSVNIGAGTACVDAINNKNSQTTGRLTCTGLSAEHWYQAEISQNERKLTDLTTGKVVGTENTPISVAAAAQLCLYDIGKAKSSSHSMRRFTGSIKRLTIEKSGEVKFDYVPRKVNGVWTFVNTVDNVPAEVQDGTLSGDEFRSTETLFAGADEFGSGRRIVSVADVRSKGRVTAHQLSFAASDGIDYLLYRCSGNAPKGADYQAWPNCEAVDYIPASSNSYVCAVPEGWGESCSLVRYFLVKPRWAAKGRSWLAETPEVSVADGAYVDTKLTLKSGDTMTVDFCPSVRQKAFAVAGCRAGAASKNITVSATMATDADNALNIYCDYNNGDQTAYQLKSSDRADRTKWYRAELSVAARCVSEIGGDWAETNDTAYADSAFETTGTCQLFYAGGSPSSGWSKFLGAIRSFTLVRDGETLADYVPFAEGVNGGFIDKVTHQRFESVPGSGYQLGVVEIDELLFGASKTVDAHAKSGLVLLVY